MRETLHTIDTVFGPRDVRVRRNRRARRMILRVDAADSSVVMTVPPWTSLDDVAAMVRERTSWIDARIAELGPRIPFEPGAAVPVHGINRTLIKAPGVRGRAVLDETTLCVPGDPAHFARRVTDWLKAEARRVIEPLADETARRGDLRRGRVTVRDTKSRWGSCSHDGRLSFSWRLIMAPSFVLEYVVAHEVAHLAERNHSARFWHMVDELTATRETGEAWLSAHGTRLHRFG